MSFSILIVDDSPEFARQLAKSLDRSIRENFQSMELPPGILLKFVPFSIESDDECATSFESRFLDIIRCQDTDTKVGAELVAIVFDYLFEIPEGFKSKSGVHFAAHAERLRPNISRYLLTQLDAGPIIAETPSLFSRIFNKQDVSGSMGINELARRICKDLSDRFKTPFWQGLKEFSQEDKLVMHAMASTDTKMANSITVNDFRDFFGFGHFAAEGSATVTPLDSLLEPHTSIKEAEIKFASIFGATFARFVTNGTSTANKIVHMAICHPGDYVLIDQSCHISHHYAMALVGSRPWYLTPYWILGVDIPGTVTPSMYAQALRRLLQTQFEKGARGASLRLPRLIVVTNCTFDGLFIRPTILFEEIYLILEEFSIADRLDEIVFLFDEAWFGYARFHPRFIEFSAMNAAFQMGVLPKFQDKLRVYSTQSVHKTLFAFRQASVVLARDPLLTSSGGRDFQEQRWRFNQAFLNQTTTSPSLGILASLDVGRRQADIEGTQLIQNALVAAEHFRKALTSPSNPLDCDIAKKYAVLSTEQMIPKDFADTIGLDTTKVTLVARDNQSGAELKTDLWKDSRVQCNKSGMNSVLMMFTPGVNTNLETELRRRLKLSAANPRQTGGVGIDPIEKINFFVPTDEDQSKRKFWGGPAQTVQFPECICFDNGPDLHQAMFDGTNPMEFVAPDSIDEDEFVVVGTFITPYPPGYPVLIPGEIVTGRELHQILKKYTGEIHGLITDPRGTQLIRCCSFP